jgi:hypothetical protein
MKTTIRFSVLIVILVLVLAVGVSFTQARQMGNSISPTNTISQEANLPWHSLYVQQELDPPRDVGAYVSIAISSFNDFLVMSYYDTTNHSLMIASPILGHAGNCGTDNNWMCVTLDGGGGAAVGMYTSIDLWGNSLDNWKMGISYYDMTNRALKAAIYTCYLGSCIWDIVTISSPAIPDVSIGLYSSFKFNSAGSAAIAYFTNVSYFSILMYAYQVPNGGNCGEGGAFSLWECKEISILTREGKYTSLDFSYDNVPYIAYYDAYEGDLRIAYHLAGIHMCEQMDWTCLNLDGYDGSDVGFYASLTAPQYSGDIYRIAYHDKTNGHLKYYDESWGPLVVNDMGTSISPMGISMGTDPDGYPVIAYQQIASDFSPPALRIARPYLVFGDEPYGNCGDNPPGYIFAYWLCSTLDNGGQYTEEADFAAIAINSRGMVGIAYSEYDSYHDVSSLKFIYQTFFHTYLPILNKH